MENQGLYSRQSTLHLNFYDEITIIGVGGTGSWIAMLLAMSGRVIKLIIFDDDTIEESNLNRTLYTQKQIGMKKVDAIKALIKERRPEQEVMTVDEKFVIEETDEPDLSYTTIIDCTDNLTVYKTIDAKRLKYFRGGYDGHSFSIYNGKTGGVWDVEAIQGYQTVSSYAVPPCIIASIITDQLLNPNIVLPSTTTFKSTGEMLHQAISYQQEMNKREMESIKVEKASDPPRRRTIGTTLDGRIVESVSQGMERVLNTPPRSIDDFFVNPIMDSVTLQVNAISDRDLTIGRSVDFDLDGLNDPDEEADF